MLDSQSAAHFARVLFAALDSMSLVNLTIAVLSTIFAGTIVGFVQGFAMAGHRAVLSGARPTTANRIFRLFTRPSAELSSTETLIVFSFVILWLGVFIGLCALPFVLASKLHLDGITLYLMGAFVVAGIIAVRMGRAAWRRVETHAV